MAATIRDIGNLTLPIPELLVIDTSLVLELVPTSPSHPNHNLAVDFLNRLQNQAIAGNCIPIMPYLVLEEIFFKICKWNLFEASRNSGLSWERYFKTNPTVIRSLIHPTLVNIYQRLCAFPFLIIDPGDLSTAAPAAQIADRMLEFIGACNLLPKDATILSEAERMGVYTIATLDSDYERADGFTVFMPPPPPSL